MKQSLTCPKCDGRKIVHVDRMQLPVFAPGFAATPATLPVAVQRGIWSGARALGSFETFICQACGYTEWYAHTPETLPLDNGDVQLIDNEPKATLR